MPVLSPGQPLQKKLRQRLNEPPTHLTEAGHGDSLSASASRRCCALSCFAHKSVHSAKVSYEALRSGEAGSIQRALGRAVLAPRGASFWGCFSSQSCRGHCWGPCSHHLLPVTCVEGTLCLYPRGLQAFSAKGWIVNTLGIVDQLVSVMTQLNHSSAKTVVDNKNE